MLGLILADGEVQGPQVVGATAGAAAVKSFSDTNGGRAFVFSFSADSAVKIAWTAASASAPTDPTAPTAANSGTDGLVLYALKGWQYRINAPTMSVATGNRIGHVAIYMPANTTCYLNFIY